MKNHQKIIEQAWVDRTMLKNEVVKNTIREVIEL
ncbi:MAG: hypothetical protein RL329_27, partial [Bacteroidota bacterium]